MNKLKKSLALIATLALASSALYACGGESSNAGTSSTNDPNSSTGDSSSAADPESSAVEEPKVELKDDDTTLSVLVWNQNDIGPMRTVFCQNNTSYKEDQIKGVEAASGGEEASEKFGTYMMADNDVDLFFMESDWILSYINEKNEDGSYKYNAPLSALGFTADDFKNSFDFVKNVGKNNDGILMGTSWQATPGCFAYRTDLAQEILGVKSPAEMQEKVKDWATFDATAKTVYDAKQIALADTLGGMWQVFQYNRSTAWVDADNKLVIDDYYKDYAERAKSYYTNGYVTKEVQWKPGWNNVAQNGKTMGLFMCSWCFGLNGTISGLQGNTETKPEDAPKGVSDENVKVDGPSGAKWNVCEGPSQFLWGGTWLGVSNKCNTKTLAHDFINYLCVDQEGMKKYAEYQSEFVNSPSIMQGLADAGTNKNAYLAGQDQFPTLVKNANSFKIENRTAYDSKIKTAFNDAVGEYCNSDSMTYDEMLNNFKKAVAKACPDVVVE